MNVEIHNIKDIINHNKTIIKGCYLAGPIANTPNYKGKFTKAERTIKRIMLKDFPVLNPSVLPEGLTKAKYNAITKAMVEATSTIILLNGWENSAGAKELIKQTNDSPKKYLVIYFQEILDELKRKR